MQKSGSNRASVVWVPLEPLEHRHLWAPKVLRASLDDLGELHWPAIVSSDFRQPEAKEGKQAEFLAHESLPFRLFERIGVLSKAVGSRVVQALGDSPSRPRVEVLRQWYY